MPVLFCVCLVGSPRHWRMAGILEEREKCAQVLHPFAISLESRQNIHRPGQNIHRKQIRKFKPTDDSLMIVGIPAISNNSFFLIGYFLLVLCWLIPLWKNYYSSGSRQRNMKRPWVMMGRFTSCPTEHYQQNITQIQNTTKYHKIPYRHKYF